MLDMKLFFSEGDNKIVSWKDEAIFIIDELAGGEGKKRG
jgi:hypothetical protein